MVDAVVSIALNRLADFLIDEAVFLGSVRQEVQWLKNELGWMQCYIASAEEKQDDNPIARKWLNDITNIAYDAEDVLDKFIIQVHDEEIKPTGCFPSMSSCVKCRKKVNLPEEVVNLHDIGNDIEQLKIRINDLSRIRELYKFESSSNKGEGNSSNSLATLRQLRRTTSFSIEENVVGHDDGTTRLLAKLLNQDRRRFVVSIYGMGGLGKTTLAGKLYRHLDVKSKFDCRAWVCVSQDYNTRDLLLRIISSFGITTEADEADEAKFKNHKELASKGKIKKTKELKQMNEEELERYLYKSLKGHSYLLVVDDIWKKEAWLSFKRAFPDCNNGSRVIITTRSQEVAENSDERTYVHKLRFLTLDESWQLFCEKAFGNPDAKGVEEQLKTLGMEMVQKCGGLPLALIVLGGLLSNKTQLAKWKAVRDHIWQNLKKDNIHIPNLFALSFNDLNYQLKLCFLYLSLFPEDFEINVDQLIRLWVAEGFVLQDENRNMEDVAKDNFHDLINRSLIQIGKISWGRVATCRVHDLLRELAIEKARELNLLYNYDQMKHSIGNSSVISSCRREALYSPKENCLWLQQSNPSLRSLLSFDPYGFRLDIMRTITDRYTKFRFLRVLKLDGYPTRSTLSKEIGKLIHLKYLGLRGSKVKYLPRSILNLRRLQTLDLFNSDMEIELPNEISKLQELSHLSGWFFGNLEIDSLIKLQSLKYVLIQSWISINTEKLGNLRELWIYGSVQTTSEFCFDSIAKLERLEQLAVKLEDHRYLGCFASLQPLTRCSNLKDLRLYGKIEKLPEDIHNVLPNLECLLLQNSWLKDDPMRLLEKLDSLMILCLGLGFYIGKNLFCSAHGFRRLEILRLDVKDDLLEWQAEEEAMPMLRGFSIPNDSSLRIPERFKSIPPPAECEFEVDNHRFKLWL
ncbi:hypothetical protein EZV62_006845 [Acer yangbiense]|uniref:NB-ARC domain-containing protein n=1 Tax=Acer yangbiense TaxID=1000413 RepID=A0A5C7I895_9ROSI|nr:hypothetical protein EZV62_006845 [Acer yangbiense]